MTREEDARRKRRRDLLLILLILPFGVLCMFMTGQVAIRLAPTWMLDTNMFSSLDPNVDLFGLKKPLSIEPLNPDILTPPSWVLSFLTPKAPDQTNAGGIIPTQPPVSTPKPPPKVDTPVVADTPVIIGTVGTPLPTATPVGPFIPPPTKPGLKLADLAITKTDNRNTYTPGTSIAYTIIVQNKGPDSAPRFSIRDNVPADISGVSVTCTPSSKCGINASSGNVVSFRDATLNKNEQITITINGLVSSGATGNLSNTAEIILPTTGGFSDAILGNNTVTDTDTRLGRSDLAITKTDNVDTYKASDTLTYTIVVTNSGPSDAFGVRVSDNKPSQIESWVWTCAMTNASGCNSTGASGITTNFSDQGLNIKVGGKIEYTVTAFLPADANTDASDIENTARIIIPNGSSLIDSNLSNNSALDTDIPEIDVSIEKTDNGASFSPNGTIPYTVTVTNNSTFDLNNIVVTDSRPSGIATWGWCVEPCTPNPDSSSADFIDTIDLTAGNQLVYQVMARAGAGINDITNIATVSAPTGLVDANTANNTATEVTPAFIDVQIVKTSNSATFAPGGTVSYTVVVTNNSQVALNGVTVSDLKPSQITSWGWCVDPCTPNPNSNSANFTDTINLTAAGSPGNSLTYNVMANVSGSRTAGDITNTATVSVPSGLVDIDTSNNTSIATTRPYIDLTITKTDGVGVDTYTPGGSLQYTVTVTNNSAFNLNGVTVTDGMPNLISSWTWSCAPAAGASCATGTNSTDINDTAVNLPNGTSVVYTINATVDNSATGALSNTATVAPPSGLVDAVPGDNTAVDTNTRLVEYVQGLPDGNVTGPSSGTWFQYTLTIPLTIDGNSDYDMVFYEYEIPGQNRIDMDQVEISISNNGTTWYTIYFWGDNIVDTNASPPGRNAEPDNYPISTSLLYGTSPAKSGILINADGGKDLPPNGTYQYLRVTAPSGDADGGCDIDSIEIWP